MRVLEPALQLDGDDPGLAWLPPLVPVALGLALGGALAPLGGVDASLAWWGVGLPLALSALLWRRLGMTQALGWSLFVAALLLGRLWAPVPMGEQAAPRFLSVEARVERVYFQGFSQGVLLQMADSGLPDGRSFAKFPAVPPLRVDDRVVVDGLWRSEWYRDAWRPRFEVSRVRDHRPRERGPRGWAWAAIDRLAVHRGLAAALLLGQERPLVGRDFRQAGLAHLMAVSGFHLGVVLVGLALLLSALRCSWWWRQGLVVLVALAYLWLTAAPIPTQRAVIMCLSLIVAGLLGRSVHPLASISLAALILLLIEPGDGQRLGFQLSLVAVLGIVTLGRDLVLLRKRLPLDPWPLDRLPWRALLWSARRLLDGLAIGFAATLATAPVLALHLGVANPWSMFATILATPLLMLVLLSGLPLLLVAGMWPGGPWEGLYLLCETGLEVLVVLTRWVAAWPGSMIAVSAPPWWLVACWPLLFWPTARLSLLLAKPVLAGFFIAAWYISTSA